MRGKVLWSVPVVVGLIAGGLSGGREPARAATAASPAPCAFRFGSLSTQGALGTLIMQVPAVPGNPSQGCLAHVDVTGRITDAAGAVPAGIGGDGGTSSLSLLFSSGEFPAPVIDVAWSAYCTVVPQPVYLRLAGAGQSAVYPLGTSRPCSQGPATESTVNPPSVRAPVPAVGLAAASGGYRVAVVDGSVLRQPGRVVEAGDSSATPFVGIAALPGGGGFWLATSDGGVYSYNGAGFYGSAYGLALREPIVGIAATPTGHGYWLVGADGGVFAFGDARYFGSTASLRLAAPVVGLATTGDGAGYWLAGADGGVFAYGDAGFYGSAGALPLVAPVVGIAPDFGTGGYWLGAADGGVFAFHAPFLGSVGTTPAAPMAGISATTDSGGYWLAGTDGGVFAFGDAPFAGSATSVVSP